MPRLTSLFLATFLAASGGTLLTACGGKSAEDLRVEAQGALDGGDAPKAMTLADEGLKLAGSDKPMAWRLEQLKLEALAKSKQGAKVPGELERLAKDYAAQVNAPLFRSLADKTKAAGDTSGAIDILAAGDKKYPEDPTFKQAINELQASGINPEEVEKLKALGYL